MIAPLSLLLIAPPIIAAFLLARAAMPRWRPAMVMLLCAMSAVPLAGASEALPPVRRTSGRPGGRQHLREVVGGGGQTNSRPNLGAV